LLEQVLQIGKKSLTIDFSLYLVVFLKNGIAVDDILLLPNITCAKG